MTIDAERAHPIDTIEPPALETIARALASQHVDVDRTGRSRARPRDTAEVATALEHAQRSLASAPADDATLPRAAEWFLDNYYLIRRVARQTEEDLPGGFVRHLPRVATGPSKGFLRIDLLARTLVAATNLEPTSPALCSFVEAYQEVAPLTIAELWALPTMLRACVLRHLVRFLDELHVPLGDDYEGRAPTPADVARRETVSPDPGVGVECAIRALRLLDAFDWKAFFARSSRVEAILCTDPAGVYARMDFETCDSYRRVVEALAWQTDRTEPTVAEAAIALASERSSDPRLGHVGHYLVGHGRPLLEQRLGYRPVALARVRGMLMRSPTRAYLVPLALLTIVPLVALGWLLAHDGVGRAAIALTTLVAAVPMSVLSAAVMRSLFARLLAPRTLPKLDFSKGLPADARTLVVIPTLLGRAEDVDDMVRQLELHYLSNPDPQLQFALLTDDVDSRRVATDAALLDRAAHAIEALNARHGASDRGPFHLLHREPRWNPHEERFMGWERKRGKLEELNRLLRGDTETSYVRRVGDPTGLVGIRFVITLDGDTQLPMGTAQRLVGALAHPLNHAQVDRVTGRTIAGYTIIQPRIETSPTSTPRTWFSRIFAGDRGFDIYTHAVSELYQDLFGAGIYVGKGIYDVDSFMRSVLGRAPENAIVSHDLFEGIHGRTALATDIVLFESYPAGYAAYTKRMHRWVRGDWQLLPWLLPWVPTVGGHWIRNQLARIDRWKIIDNLRRSLSGPAALVLLVSAWTWLPGSPLAWTVGALALVLAPLAPAIARDRGERRTHLARGALALAFLAHEAAIVTDAILRVGVRTAITRKRLLQWTSASNTAAGHAGTSPRRLYWRTLAWSPILAVAIAALVAWARPVALVVAAPLLAVWLVAPELARRLSQPRRPRARPLRPDERRYLRLLARRTWRFFDAFVGPNDQWLPVDNHQAEPHEQTAHRTSPTNIGLMLLATMSAYDFGYLGPSELALRVRRAFDSIARLTHYQGHLLNWYDTKSLQPLLPRYVSTVDSGNFAGCLVAIAQGCREIAIAPVVRACVWDGLSDSAELLAEVVDAIPTGSAGGLRSVVARLRQVIALGRDHPDQAYATLRALCDDVVLELDREVLAFLETGAHRHEPDLLQSLRESIDRLHQQLGHMQQEQDALLPWLALADERAARAVALPAQLRLDEIPATTARLCGELDVWLREQRRPLPPELEASAKRLTEAFTRASEHAARLHAELIALAELADDELRGIDFRLLYDRERKLFRIGYNVTADQADANHYDLLASEARLASYLAIVLRQVPETHWYALGRPMIPVAGRPALLSWGGTMFEYLMPNLLMRSRPGTLLASTGERAVEAQIAWADELDVPWGVSESAFAHVDANHTYQYRSFGVPGLGFKRGLDDDRVVTPYASALALSIRPRAVVANLRELEATGMLGTYGMFEALDLTPERTTKILSHTVVRSYMAHHQGMLLVSLANHLNARSMLDRFHADPRIATGELLLNELAPDVAPPEWPQGEASDRNRVEEPAMPRPPEPWSIAGSAHPQAFVLTNGRLTSLVTDAGGGRLSWLDLALTRYQPDATLDDDGMWIYLRDEDTRRVWRATSSEGRTTFAMHKVELHRRHEGISVHLDVGVAPADDVEVRLVTLHNETDAPRRLTVTSAARPVLVDRQEAPVHPAFSSLFVESELLAELDALMFARRPKSVDEPPAVMVHRLVRDGAAASFAGYETDRAAFLGRGGSLDAPVALAAEGALRGKVGAVLDPIMSLMASVELKAKATVVLAFVTTVARSRAAAVELARRYGSLHAVRWALRDAELEAAHRLQRTKVEPALVPSIQRVFSGLLFADPTLRAAPDALAAARPCQRRLWGRGISGDDPIVLVRVHDSNAPMLRETLSAQRYLRSCGVRVDVVLVDEQTTGYDSSGSGTLRRVLAQHDDNDWLGKHGGIHVLAADQASDDERRHLEAAARVVLDTRDGSLAARLERTVEPPARLPRFEPTLTNGAPSPTRPPPPLAFDNGTGGFTADGREYMISIPAGGVTPAPWCNVLANETFGCLTSESSLGVTWSLNAGENKLTPWRNDPVLDAPSEVLYLRDEETAAVWSPTPLPAGRADATRVRHGAGYTIYERDSHGLRQTMTVFVPPHDPLKIVRLRLENLLPRHRRVTATYYAEWVLGPRPAAQRAFIASEHDRTTGGLFATCGWDAELADRVAFLASEREVHGFTTDREEFLGRGGELARPAALARWGLSGSVAPGADPCAALQIHLELAPGEAVETHFVLGQAGTGDLSRALVARFRERAAVDHAWDELGAFWDRLLDDVRVATPEPAMDLLLNRWLLYQALSARIFGRTGFYQASGAFGYRDQLQDVLALLHAAPERTRAHILEAAAHQFEQGDVLHWWHPPSGRGVRTRCSDDLLWLPYVTAEYVATTGDVAILAEPVPFLTGAPLAPDEHDRYAAYERGAAAPLLEHCRRALEHGATAGAHGLPLMGDGDWNDGMNHVGADGHGESVWLGWFLCATMDRFAALCVRADDEAAAATWRARADALRARIEDCAWDGAWYLRAFHDDGSLVGSATSRECRIDSIAQSWAVLSSADDAPRTPRVIAAVRAADDQLVRAADRLVLLFWPPFDSTLHDPGYVRAYPPGVRENGGQYTHAATWLGWAHAALGDGERAARIFRLLNPILRSATAADADRYRVEPYVLAGDIYSCAPWIGRGGWTWYTGSAAWMWRLGVEAILGLQRSAGELRIAPCIPPMWSGFEAWVHVGRQRVHIVVENPDRVASGVALVTLDGARLDADRVRLDPAVAGAHEVHVRLGAHANVSAPTAPPFDPDSGPKRESTEEQRHAETP